jgi:hypothetical protein
VRHVLHRQSLAHAERQGQAARSSAGASNVDVI